MNCKPGDLAVVVRSRFKSNIGKLCRVICFSDSQHWDWKVEAISPLQHATKSMAEVGIVWPGQITQAHDFCLRPIRDNDGEDETLAWAGKPQEVTA